MTIYLILHTLLQQYECIADCGDTSTSGDHQLNPQVFFPNPGGDSGGNQNCGPSTGSGYQNYNSGQQSGTSGQTSTGYQPNQAYSQPVAYGVLPQQYQSGSGGGNGGNGNGGRRGPLVCDNTAEREAFKKCVSDALRSLKNILENCKRELGENAQECNLSDDCLAKLTGKDKGNCNGGGNSSGNRNNSYGECSDDDDDSYSSRRPRKRNRRSRNNDSYGSTDSLEEFIKYLESRLCEKDGDNGGRKSSSRRKKSRRSYRDEDSIDDTRSRRRRSQKSRRRKSKKKDSCSDVCEENM